MMAETRWQQQCEGHGEVSATMQEWDHQQPRRAWPKSPPSASWGDVVAVEQGDVKFRAPGVWSLRVSHVLSCRKGCPNNV